MNRRNLFQLLIEFSDNSTAKEQGAGGHQRPRQTLIANLLSAQEGEGVNRGAFF